MTALSVLVPTYERTEYLRDAIDSVLAQSFGDFVVLVGDNSRTDAVERVIAGYDDARIHYHRNTGELGTQGNFVDLVRRAETPFVATMHDDNLWDPEFLATLLPPMISEPDVAASMSDFWTIDEHGRRLVALTDANSLRTHRSVLPRCRIEPDLVFGLRMVAAWCLPSLAVSAVLRTDAVRSVEFHDEYSPLYDLWLGYRLVTAGHAFHYDPTRLACHREHSGSLTSAGIGECEDRIFACILAEQADAGPVLDEIRGYRGWLRWGRGRTAMLARDAARSQAEFGLAAEDLHGMRRTLAKMISRHRVPWVAARCALIATGRR